MEDGERVLLWIEDNGHTVGDIAQRIGYSRQSLATALNQDRISEGLASILYERFGLQVTPSPPQQADSPRPLRRPERVKIPKPSKLDTVADDIATLLRKGLVPSDIAKKPPTHDRHPPEWRKRPGFRQNRTDP